MTTASRALLLDLGGTVFRSGSELMRSYGRHEPRAGRVVRRNGPFGPERDESWVRLLRREITEREYWALRADEVGRALGERWGESDLMHALYSMPGEELMRPEATDLIADARAEGIPVGVLTNDLGAFHGDAAIARHPFLAEVDVLLDGSATGVLKPDPEAYRLACEAPERAPQEIVFLDDMPWNVSAGTAAGMIAVLVDMLRPEQAFDTARDHLGLARRAA
jgi:putative hydrolase of the HAD superfamily